MEASGRRGPLGAEGVPENWFTRSPHDYDEDEPLESVDYQGATTWAAAAQEAPAAVERWLEHYRMTVEMLGGTSTGVLDGVRLEVSVDGQPRELRLWRSDNDWSSVVLWSDVNFDLWLEGLALQETQRQRAIGRRSSEPVVDDELEEDDDAWLDPDRYRYIPLSDRDPELAARALDRYAELFVAFARFPRERLGEARETVELSVAVESPEPIVRCTSHFTGETEWLYEWDGSEEELTAFVEDQAYKHGDWVDRDRVIAGPTEWDEL